MDMKLYLVRHGETQMNVDKLYYGWTDCPLNENGERQAEKLKEFFKTVPLDKIICSSLLRASSTAEKINEGKNIPIFKEDDFRELHFGAWEGKDFCHIKENYPEEYRQWAKDWQGFAIPEGEAFSVFYERVTNRLQQLISEEEENSSILLVSHNGVMSAMLCYLTGAGPSSFWRFNFSQEAYSMVSIRRGNIVIEKINSTL